MSDQRLPQRSLAGSETDGVSRLMVLCAKDEIDGGQNVSVHARDSWSCLEIEPA
ncbi:hypothetical protein D3C86_2173500 [compost metagenome]